jgi:hypothetical protein
MIHCRDCEYFRRGPNGEVSFTCDPFSTIKEPECLQKWALIKINQMIASYQATLDYYRKLGPMQEKMFRFMEREMGDLDESDRWKVDEGEDEPPDSWGDETTGG